jgi:nitrate/nitrite transport system ATP-binding protein
MPLLSLHNVHKGFDGRGTRAEVLRDVEFRVEEGEFVAVVGWSGAGKTTLLSLMSGLLMPDIGRALFDGREITGPGPERAVVFQNYSLLPWLNVLENVRLAVDSVLPNVPEQTRRERAMRYLEMVGLQEAVAKKPAQLSGGMRQRVSVARALAMEPRVLLLDEPLGALDALTRGMLQEELVRIRQQSGTTVVLITNDVDEALLTADRVVPLTAGPAATLGPSFPVTVPHPRDRKTLRSEPEFVRLRREIVAFLLGEGGRTTARVSRQLVLPDIAPEDLSYGRPLTKGGRRALRRSEIRREEVDI